MQSRITSPFSTDLGYRLLPDSLFVSREKILTPHLSSSSLPHENGQAPCEPRIFSSRGKYSSLPRKMFFPPEGNGFPMRGILPCPKAQLPSISKYSLHPTPRPQSRPTSNAPWNAPGNPATCLGLSTHPSHPLTIPLASCSFARRNQQGGKGEMRHNANFVVKMLCRTK